MQLVAGIHGTYLGCARDFGCGLGQAAAKTLYGEEEMVVLVASILAMLSHSIDTRVPDCLYVAYGCEYYIFNLGDGTGDALVTCDGGGTFSSYSGAMGDCPDG